MKVQLTIKNYRCFVRPTTIEIGKGFTAFVGVNNAGKSTLMRFILEFRPLLQKITYNNGNFINSITQHDSINLLHVLDHEEVFSNLNEEGIEFWFDFTYEQSEESQLHPRKVLNRLSRNLQWKTEITTRDGKISTIPQNKIGLSQPSALTVNGVRAVDLKPLFDVATALANSVYIGPFRNTINIGTRSDYLDIEIGESFIKRFRSLKTGANKRYNTAMTRLTEDIRKIFGFETLNIEAEEDNKSLHITINGRPYKQHELGSGLAQFILVLVNASIKAPQYILIDEPELNLHPSLQLDFLTTLGTYAKEGVWFSSHSLGLSRSVSERIYSVQRVKDGDSTVNSLDAMPRLSEFLGEMSFSSHKELGFDKILLVEGATEVKVIQQILRKMSKDHKVLLLPLYGRITGDMAEEIDEIMRISTHLSVIIDSERKAPNEPLEKKRQDFLDLCKKRNITCHVLSYRATENYFSDRAIKEVFGSTYRALEPYEKLGDMTPRWHKAQNWKLASTMTLDEIRETDFGRFLEQL